MDGGLRKSSRVAKKPDYFVPIAGKNSRIVEEELDENRDNTDDEDLEDELIEFQKPEKSRKATTLKPSISKGKGKPKGKTKSVSFTTSSHNKIFGLCFYIY